MLTFAKLWENHPVIQGDTPLLDTKVYENQCAINVSAALIRCGVDLGSYTGVRSWQQGKPRYPIRAEELASWLASPAARLPRKVEKLPPKEIFENDKRKKNIRGRTGIVFFQNFWGPGRQGDHIDLWNGFRLTRLRSVGQIYLWGFGSDYRDSDSAWFWEIP